MEPLYSLEELANRVAINDLYARYVHAVDAADMNTLDQQVFLPETTFDWTDVGYIKYDWITAKSDGLMSGEMFQFVFHLCGNIRIDFNEDQTKAYVKSKTIHPTGTKDKEGNAKLFQVQGTYTDVLIRTNEGWRITERVWKGAWIAGGLTYVESMAAMLE